MIGKKVAVGISGGVDSAVSALLLKRAEFDVVGVHLYCWPPKSEIERDGVTREEWIKKNGCRADEDRASALKTALEIGIPFKELDFSEEYNTRVINYFYEEYEAGRTPNPDVLCNSEIKFGLFLDWALRNEFDFIATGHYAKSQNSNLIATDHNPLLATVGSNSPAEFARLNSRLEFPTSLEPSNSNLRSVVQMNDGLANNLSFLQIPKDKHKDQTYFLWKLTEKELKHVIFPLGGLLKSEVREIAKEAGLSVAEKKDSQGICFVGNVEVREFLKRRLLEKPGEVVDTNGNVIGNHKGVAFYTIGERGGWTIDSKTQKLKTEKTQNGDITKVYYVVDKIASTNTLIVGDKSEVMSKKVIITGLSFVNHNKGEDWKTYLGDVARENGLFLRIRHGGELIKIQKIHADNYRSQAGKRNSRAQKEEFAFELEKEVFGVASGQSAVIYSGNGEFLGGGVIV